MNREEIERCAEVLHEVVGGWPWADTPETTKEISRCQARAVLQHLASQRQEQECGPVEKCPVCRHNTVHVGCVTATLEASRALAASAAKAGEQGKIAVELFDELKVTRAKLQACERALERVRPEILKRWRFKNIMGEYRCDDCCHAWPDEHGLPLTCAEEPMDLCREGHECDIRPVLIALASPEARATGEPA